MSKPTVEIDVRQDKIHLLLSALKVAEGFYTTKGMWLAAKEVGKLQSSLNKQIFSYERVEIE
jgi:hypothetical protein